MSVKKHGLVAALALVAGTTLAAGIAGYDKMLVVSQQLYIRPMSILF